MPSYHVHIEEKTLSNKNFRQVLFTGKHSQLVLMTLKPNEEIGLEVHADNDQFFRFESGVGKAIVDGVEYPLVDGDALVVVAGSKHNIINTSPNEDLQLYTIYSPVHHPDGTIHTTKQEALDAEKND